jgi:hypothetical protein
LTEGQRLWDSLYANYPGELRPPMRTTAADWPAIDRAWRDFLITHKAGRGTAASLEP